MMKEKETMTIENYKEQMEAIENPSIKVTWKDSGQVMMKILCYPEEVDKIKELFKFIEELDDIVI